MSALEELVEEHVSFAHLQTLRVCVSPRPRVIEDDMLPLLVFIPST